MTIRVRSAKFLKTSTFASVALAIALVGCGGSDGEETGSGGGRSVNAKALSACPGASSLLEKKDWSICLAGQRIAGADTFNKEPCELQIGSDGSFQYLRNGAVALQTSAPSTWQTGFGLYQNMVPGGGPIRLFIGVAQPNQEPVAGQASVTEVHLSFVERMDDDIQIKYLDVMGKPQTYNCRVNVL